MGMCEIRDPAAAIADSGAVAELLAALCDIFDVSPGDLIEPVRETSVKAVGAKAGSNAGGSTLQELRPRPARVAKGRH